MVYIWIFDIVEDDILARHNKHFSQAHYHFALRGVIMLHYQRHNLPRALRALTSATTNIRNCSICRTKFFPLAMFQLSKLSTARYNCQNYRFLSFSILCHWVRICIHNPYIAEKMKWFVLQFERMILFRTAKRYFWGRQLLQDGVCFVQSSTTKTTSSLINGNPHSSIAFVLFWHQEQRKNLMKSSAANCASHLRWHLAAQSTAEHLCLWRLSIDNRHKLEYFGK